MHDPVKTDMRLAGRLLRYHTWPHTRPQTVGEHSWQLARILLTVYPEASAAMFAYIVVHDVGELHTGDAPYPVKGRNPALKAEMDRLEQNGLEDMATTWGLSLSAATITNREAIIIKACELVEMYEWGLEELNLGNRYAWLVANRCLEAFHLLKVPDPAGARLISYISQRQKAFYALQSQSVMNPNTVYPGDPNN